MNERAPRWAALVLASAFIAAGIVGCSRSGTVTPSAGTTPALNAASADLLPTTAPGLPSFNADKFQQLLGQLQGTPVVVNIWASWCVPCRAEAPILARAAKRYGQTIQFLGVDIQDNIGGATAFQEEFNIPYPSVFDPNGEIRDSLGLLGQPDTIFYGTDQSKVTTVSGQLDPDTFSTNLQDLLATTT